MIPKEKHPHISTMIPHLWELLAHNEKEFFQIYSTFEQVAPKETLLEEGMIPEYCYVLIQGQVKVTMESYGGRRHVVNLICPGKLFGYRTFFMGKPSAVRISAVGVSLVYKFPLTVLEDIARENPKVSYWLMLESYRDIFLSDRRSVGLLVKQSRARMAEGLLLLKEMYGLKPNGSLNINPTRRDMGELSNMTTSNAIRTLNAFEEEGLIKTEGREITILNEKSIDEIARKG